MTNKQTKRVEPRKTERFHQIPIFSNLSGQEVGRVLQNTKEHLLPKGTVIFQPKDPNDGFYIILDGKVEITLPAGGDETSIATLSNRSIFGEMSFIAKRPRSMKAVAVEETRVNKIDGVAFQTMLDKGDVAAYKVVHNIAILIAGRLRMVEDELLRTIEQLAPERKATKLAEMQEFRQTLYKDWSF